VIAPMRQGQSLTRRSASKGVLSSELPRPAGPLVAGCRRFDGVLTVVRRRVGALPDRRGQRLSTTPESGPARRYGSLFTGSRHPWVRSLLRLAAADQLADLAVHDIQRCRYGAPRRTTSRTTELQEKESVRGALTNQSVDKLGARPAFRRPPNLGPGRRRAATGGGDGAGLRRLRHRASVQARRATGRLTR
jgi:hypothetical protein